MTKAYDRIEWLYLRSIMLAIGFPHPFVDLVMRCVYSVQYGIQVNGRIGPLFSPSRGLRQGDPLSPYLFLLSVEGLAGLLAQFECTGVIHRIKVARGAPSITHLFFADDALLFARATDTELQCIMNILAIYEKASGQQVNLRKSSVSRNVSVASTTRLGEIINMRLGIDGDKYIGLPMMIGRSKRLIFEGIETRIKKNMGVWKDRHLSKAGCEVLIKSVLQAIPSYIMSCFVFPLISAMG